MLKDFFRRLFFRRSTAYFLLSFLSTCAQIILRTALFVIDDDGARRKPPASLPPDATQSLYRLLSDGGLESCHDVPEPCERFQMAQIGRDSGPPNFCSMIAAFSSNKDNRLEDVVFIAIHAYLLLVTIYALARESIPHIIFIFVARFLATVLAFGRLLQTIAVERSLSRLIDKANCGSQREFFGPSFFARRFTFEGLLLGISVLSIVIEGPVAYKLCRIYSERPWRVIQVSSEMRRMYRLLLGYSVVVQMMGLVVPTMMGLSADQLLNTYFKTIVGNHKFIYAPLLLFLTFLLPFWIALGWFALRREWKRATFIFLGFGLVFLGIWLTALDSAMLVWTFTTWWFYATFYAVSVALLIASLVLAVLCRRNFDKNLDHYLMVQSRLSAMDFTHAHFEKDSKLDEGHVPDEWEPELESKMSIEKEDPWRGPEKEFEYD